MSAISIASMHNYSFQFIFEIIGRNFALLLTLPFRIVLVCMHFIVRVFANIKMSWKLAIVVDFYLSVDLIVELESLQADH